MKSTLHVHVDVYNYILYGWDLDLDGMFLFLNCLQWLKSVSKVTSHTCSSDDDNDYYDDDDDDDDDDDNYSCSDNNNTKNNNSKLIIIVLIIINTN